MGKGTISITEKNRDLVGFTGALSEYLVIPPEVVVNDVTKAIDTIAEEAFSKCGNLQYVVILDGITCIANGALRLVHLLRVFFCREVSSKLEMKRFAYVKASWKSIFK